LHSIKYLAAVFLLFIRIGVVRNARCGGSSEKDGGGGGEREIPARERPAISVATGERRDAGGGRVGNEPGEEARCGARRAR
jgi:hypothetical protein